MYCNNCGEEIDAGADSCPNCGSRITNKAGNKKILPKTNKENDDRKSSRTRFAIIAIIAGLIILNIALLIYREIGLNICNVFLRDGSNHSALLVQSKFYYV